MFGLPAGGLTSDGEARTTASLYLKMPFDFELFEDFDFGNDVQLGARDRTLRALLSPVPVC